MRLIDDLRAEHEVIERVLGSLQTYVERRARGEAAGEDGAGYLRFFRLFAGTWHHAREEDTLFPALERHLELPPDSGPIFSIVDQHRRMAVLLDGMEPLLSAGRATPEETAKLRELAARYAHDLLAHIDAENSVLLPESDERLRQAGVHELSMREATAEELAAKADGERLAGLYPPTHVSGAVRGEGCVICPSYGATCGGLEREWWTDEEWEAFENREG
ncbi:MAG TPA: hemerythrin domain-containing protein [Thermoanaerobaculia bacterium]|nr:hemerythrin domain-containing protein [Thermoanaerobaculia bacterium]HQR65911.1 hemerythrin domain-containing protein [Thermoanaerobaculia bacterium]